MNNAPLFRMTLSNYEASLRLGKSGTLYRYCKIHNINYPGLRYWMKKHSIALPDPNPSMVIPSACAPQRLMPLTILPPEDTKRSVLQLAHIQGVSITIADDIVVRIKEISPADLASLIVSCQKR